MTSDDIALEKEQCISDLISNCEYEISEMQKILDLIKTEKWDEVGLTLTLKNPEEWKNLITKFNFKNCMPEKYIKAIKKLIRLGFEEGIQKKLKFLDNIKQNNSTKLS